MESAPIRVFIVDDHPVVRDGLSAILSTSTDFEVVGLARDGREALLRVAALAPDVMLLDLEMPELDGVETLRALKSQGLEVQVIVFTAFDTDDRIVGAVQAGARGYLLKGAPREDLFRAIRVVHQGGSLLEPVVASKLMNHMTQVMEEQPESLTDREIEVLGLLANGNTNRDIAGQLFITERTVKFHVSSILGKLGAGNRTEAVRLAAQRGLVKL
jgi:DNA-binding NarL/FixJ family response regulator